MVSNLPTVSVRGTDAASLQAAVSELTRQITQVDGDITRLIKEAEKLLELKREAESQRMRLWEQRNALRGAIRHLEDSE